MEVAKWKGRCVTRGVQGSRAAQPVRRWGWRRWAGVTTRPSSSLQLCRQGGGLTWRYVCRCKQGLGAGLEQGYAAATGRYKAAQGVRQLPWCVSMDTLPLQAHHAPPSLPRGNRSTAACNRVMQPPAHQLTCGSLPEWRSCHPPWPAPWPPLRRTCNPAAGTDRRGWGQQLCWVCSSAAFSCSVAVQGSICSSRHPLHLICNHGCTSTEPGGKRSLPLLGSRSRGRRESRRQRAPSGGTPRQS